MHHDHLHRRWPPERVVKRLDTVAVWCVSSEKCLIPYIYLLSSFNDYLWLNFFSLRLTVARHVPRAHEGTLRARQLQVGRWSANKNEIKKLIFCAKDKTVFIYIYTYTYILINGSEKELLLFTFGIKFLIKYNVSQPSCLCIIYIRFTCTFWHDR